MRCDFFLYSRYIYEQINTNPKYTYPKKKFFECDEMICLDANYYLTNIINNVFFILINNHFSNL